MDILDEIRLLQARQSNSSYFPPPLTVQKIGGFMDSSYATMSESQSTLQGQNQDKDHPHYHHSDHIGDQHSQHERQLKILVPSPRGIQDAFFDLFGEDDAPLSSAAEPNVQFVQHQPLAVSKPCRYTNPPKPSGQQFSSKSQALDVGSPGRVSHPSNPLVGQPPGQLSNFNSGGYVRSNNLQNSSGPLTLTICPPQFPADSITPWIEEPAASSIASAGKGSLPDVDSAAEFGARERSFAKENESSEICLSQHEQFADKKLKNVGGPTSRVMPPTAKSIIERRERALREGRRSEARLNEEERRILRRLRNRESAERCARRKNEQAQLMSIKIEQLESQNSQLRSLATAYEAEIAKLEKILWQRRMKQQQSV